VKRSRSEEVLLSAARVGGMFYALYLVATNSTQGGDVEGLGRSVAQKGSNVGG
jgi:hypothetical protein